jgi:hypothetical protein
MTRPLAIITICLLGCAKPAPKLTQKPDTFQGTFTVPNDYPLLPAPTLEDSSNNLIHAPVSHDFFVATDHHPCIIVIPEGRKLTIFAMTITPTQDEPLDGLQPDVYVYGCTLKLQMVLEKVVAKTHHHRERDARGVRLPGTNGADSWAHRGRSGYRCQQNFLPGVPFGLRHHWDFADCDAITIIRQ